MPKYIEAKVPQSFDDAADNILDHIESAGVSSSVSGDEVKKLLLDLNGHCYFDETGTEGDLELVKLKARAQGLAALLRKEREERTNAERALELQAKIVKLQEMCEALWSCLNDEGVAMASAHAIEENDWQKV